MGWANHHIEALMAGKTVQFRPKGNSMTGKIESGNLCTVEPVEPSSLKINDIVLCKVKGNQYLHLIKAQRQQQYLIGNNRGGENGWIGPQHIFGRLISVKP